MNHIKLLNLCEVIIWVKNQLKESERVNLIGIKI